MVDGRPDAMIALARQLCGVGEQDHAFDLAARAMIAAPDDGDIRTRAAELLSESVPKWHFLIVRDKLRNEAYDRALQRAITPGCRVLEIGTGSGLLAMMAARHGANVVTCEANPAIAAAARDVIAANGLSDRVRVITKHSSDVTLSDTNEPADILVSEIVSNDLLSEGVLPAHSDAMKRLLKPGAAVIPARGRIRVALAHDAQWQRHFVGEVSGFDLSLFNRLARPNWELPVLSECLSLRSAAATLFDFDFGANEPSPNQRRALSLQSMGGEVNGIVQWISLEMDNEGRYDNQPGVGAPSCWGALFWPMHKALYTVEGQNITLVGSHEVDRVRIWCE